MPQALKKRFFAAHAKSSAMVVSLVVHGILHARTDPSCAGLGGAGGLGFSMPEINLFGVRSRGEKIFIILDSTPWIMLDEIGGIPAYTIIKEELVNILGTLGPAVIFNVAVFGGGGQPVACFPQMVPASASNVRRVEEWLKPLNAVKPGMGAKEYGVKTLGPGGTVLGSPILQEPLQNDQWWIRPMMVAMELQADAIFVLSHGWGTLWHVVRARMPERYFYTPRDLLQAFETHRAAHRPKIPAASGLGGGSRERFTINVIHFVRQEDPGERESDNFKRLTRLTRGQYRTLSGLAAIQSSISRSDL